MMRLKSADQDARVDKHGLNAIRVNTLAAGGFIAQQGRCAVVAFCPVMKPPRPLLGICALQMRHRLRRNMILSDLLKPAFDGQTLSLGLRLQRGCLCLDRKSTRLNSSNPSLS